MTKHPRLLGKDPVQLAAFQQQLSHSCWLQRALLLCQRERRLLHSSTKSPDRSAVDGVAVALLKQAEHQLRFEVPAQRLRAPVGEG